MKLIIDLNDMDEKKREWLLATLKFGEIPFAHIPKLEKSEYLSPEQIWEADELPFS